jgi:hypothetical protein
MREKIGVCLVKLRFVTLMRVNLLILLFLTACEFSPYYGTPPNQQNAEAQNRCRWMCRSEFVWCRQDKTMTMPECLSQQERCNAFCEIK